MIVASGYIREVMSTKTLKATVAKLCLRLKHLSKQFDTIAFRGLSGAMVGPMVAVKLNKKMLAVRKPENSHAIKLVEGDYSAKKYIVVDDLIDSGATIISIGKTIEKAYKKENTERNKYSFMQNLTVPTFVGLAIYNQTIRELEYKKIWRENWSPDNDIFTVAFQYLDEAD